MDWLANDRKRKYGIGSTERHKYSWIFNNIIVFEISDIHFLFLDGFLTELSTYGRILYHLFKINKPQLFVAGDKLK